MLETPDLTEVEMEEILKDLARNSSNGAARIAAIKALREIKSGEKPSDDFEGLDELAKARSHRRQAS